MWRRHSSPAIVSADSDEVCGDRRDPRLLEGEGTSFDRLIGYGHTDMLAYVLGLRGDDEELQRG